MLNNKVAYHTIKTVILEVNKAEDEGGEYNAKRKTFVKNNVEKYKIMGLKCTC